MENVLKQYILYRGKFPVKTYLPLETFLFVNGLGEKVSHMAVYEAFQKYFKKQASLTREIIVGQEYMPSGILHANMPL